MMRPFTSRALLGSLAVMPADGAGAGAASAAADSLQKCTVAAGCFWGVEHAFRKAFVSRGLVDARVGYCGGKTDDPSYKQVCSGTTGHAEALQITYDASKVSYRDLIEFFYRMHDPTSVDRQGPDRGTQYRSAIFTHSDEQAEIAKDITERVSKQWWTDAPVSTVIVPAGKWWDAEDYHQLYLQKNPSGYECPTHYVRNFPPLS
ncbi:Peptide-methionine (S)-S-oxide reductase [Ascosphaera acerosa]|nr:Peptide-methionine (S)-S-oxide reductase [Ascosphaera acerosa]